MMRHDEGVPITDGGNLAIVNPIRYRGYFYDTETGRFLNSRYYDPETGRFLNGDAYLNANGDIVGFNMFAYCSNNPVNKLDETGTRANFIEKIVVASINKALALTKGINTVIKAVKIVSKAAKIVGAVQTLADEMKMAIYKSTLVKKTHVTTPTAMLDGGPLFGKIGLSETVSDQNKKNGLVYTVSDVGNDQNKYGAGIDIEGVVGAEVGVSSNINVYAGVQVTPWVHAEASLGLDGIGASVGIDIGNTSYDFEIKGGWGSIGFLGLAIFAPDMIPIFA